ncbi:hypothetical protein H2200_002495 [Cladophialophora chaetospira]|uniref:Catechol 1,2-dioxygenase n=1 Tax=Cladophialophora chaetospira TaxID=386627 RepID=A0AA38XJ42_9EURO|nr:hypothetical protein H2200_002495 [Cladophialophora chaetospira]
MDAQRSVRNGETNGISATAGPEGHHFDANLTSQVIGATGPKANPRLASILPNLTRHLHDFMRESEITSQELMAAFDLLAWAGRMTDDKRHEVLLVGDVFGLEPLADDITYTLAADRSTIPTVLGPFWRANAPLRSMGDTIVFGIESGDHTYMHGRIVDAQTGGPINNAELDIWETAPNGKYEQQDPDQIDMNLRGRFRTGEDGSYNLYCLRPTTYAIPQDGPAGKLLQLLDRHPMRPAHIHCIVTAAGYKRLTTELFDRRDKHVYDDAVFAVKEDLIVDFVPKVGDPKAHFDLEYNFKLARQTS